MTLSCVWAGVAKGYDSLLVARMFQGMGGAAADTVAPALVGDVYFLHERGRAMVSSSPASHLLPPLNILKGVG